MRQPWVIMWLIVVLPTAGAPAATVTFTLDLTDPSGKFLLTASDSLEDNGGIASYGLTLTGPISALEQRSPYALNLKNFGPIGFGIRWEGFRTYEVPIVRDLRVAAAQYAPGPAENFLYGIGQIPNSFANLGLMWTLPGDATTENPWGAPITIARGYYDPGQGPIHIKAYDLFANVFLTAGSSDTIIPAQVITRVIRIVPEPASFLLSIIGVAFFNGSRVRR